MRKAVCPIDLECASYPCHNYSQCKDLTISWEIPYYSQEDTLIVRPYGWRCEWDDEAQGTHKRFCLLPSGSYKVLDGSDHEFEMKNRLRKAWIDAGWATAVPLTDKPRSDCHTEKQETTSTTSPTRSPEEDTDSIPF